jgi:CheY-like chemotaxis protein
MSHETVLVVDDNPENLMLLELLLASENFTVQTARSAQEALAALASSAPDVMLTDIQMPDVDGLELIRQVRLDPFISGIRIVAVSANAMKEDIQEAYAAGCNGYITKPTDAETLAASVREQLERRKDGEKTRPAFGPALDEGSPPGGEFLVDCTRKVEQLVSQPSAAVHREHACEVLHQCAGTAGALGYPHITSLARSLESHSAALTEQEFVDGLYKLADLLASMREPAATRTT